MTNKGSDSIDMTINIGSEFLKVSVSKTDQSTVREAETAIKRFCQKLRKDWPDCNDKQILAMAAYQFAFWYRELQKTQDLAAEQIAKGKRLIDELTQYNPLN